MTDVERKIVKLAMRYSGIGALHAFRAGMWSAGQMRDGVARGRAWWNARRAAR